MGQRADHPRPTTAVDDRADADHRAEHRRCRARHRRRPSALLRSIDTDLEAPNLAIAVGDSAMIVYSQSYSNEEVTLLNVGGDVREVEVPGGTSQIVARPGTDDFLLASDDWVGNEQPPEILVAADGTTSEVTSGPSRDYGIWGLRYLPATGEAIVNDSGGVYAIDRAGLARRLSPGTLVAVGDNHVLARECDESLTCSYVRIDGVSGERTMVTAPDLDAVPGLRLQPQPVARRHVDGLLRLGGQPARPACPRLRRGHERDRRLGRSVQQQHLVGRRQLRAVHRRGPPVGSLRPCHR